jgi:hypothetical protein
MKKLNLFLSLLVFTVFSSQHAGADEATTLTEENMAHVRYLVSLDPDQDFPAAGDCASIISGSVAPANIRLSRARATFLKKGASPGSSQLNMAWSEFDSLINENPNYAPVFYDTLIESLARLPGPVAHRALLTLTRANREADLERAMSEYGKCVSRGLGCPPEETHRWQFLAWQIGIVKYYGGSQDSVIDLEIRNKWKARVHASLPTQVRNGLLMRPMNTEYDIRNALRYMANPESRLELLALPAPADVSATSDEEAPAADAVLPQIMPHRKDIRNSINAFMTMASIEMSALRSDLGNWTQGKAPSSWDKIMAYRVGLGLGFSPLNPDATVFSNKLAISELGDHALNHYILAYASAYLKQHGASMLRKLFWSVYEKDIAAEGNTAQTESRYMPTSGNLKDLFLLQPNRSPSHTPDSFRDRIFENERHLVPILRYLALVTQTLKSEVESGRDRALLIEFVRTQLSPLGVVDILMTATDSLYIVTPPEVRTFLKQALETVE